MNDNRCPCYNTGMTTSTDIHGHEVLALVAQAAPPFTMESLRATAAARWGAEVRYHTCSATGMTLDALLEFLLARGKIVTIRGLLATDPAKICNQYCPVISQVTAKG